MRKFYNLVAMLCAFAVVGLTSCEDPVEPTPVDPFAEASLEVKLVGADVDRATVSVTAEVLKAVGYVVMPVEGEMTAPAAADIFTNGKMENIVEGSAQVTFRNLEPETNYVAYFAGRISSDQVWEQVKEFKFKTSAEPIIPVLTAKLESTEATSATIQIYAENVSRVAYLAEPLAEDGSVPETPSMQVIFAKGKVAEMTQGDNTLVIKNLSPNTEYVAFLAGEIAGIEEYMEEPLVVRYIRTTDFADAIAVRDITYRGFTVDVKVDPSVKEQNHMIKWSTSSLYLYNRNGGSPSHDAEIMNLHDTAWGGMNLFNESTSIVVDELHSYVYDEYGQPTENYYYEALVPGQPQVFIAGEYRRGESFLGWGMGYYKPLFDYDQFRADSAAGTMVDEAAYWEGFYQHLDVQVKKPEPLPEDFLTVEITTEPADAQVKVTADESLDRVAIMIMSEYEYGVASQWLPEEHMQWFATSIEAVYEGVTMIVDPFREDLGFNGTIQTALSEYFYEIPRESKFWVDVVGLRGDADGDGFIDGHEQVYKHFEFYLPQPTKPAPEFEVVALESTPYEVSFNVKCPTKDAQKGKCIANYEKEWLMAGMTAEEIVYNYGVDFTTVEIMKINTDEGLTLTYPSRPDAVTYYAAMIANDEGTETYSEAVSARSLPEPAADKVESELFESLKGEWTATATVTFQLYNTETEEYEPQTAVHTCDMTIGAVEYPETMSEEDYATFERHGVDRETATAYYEEFKAAAKTFNDNTRAQNRILVNGYDFAGGYHNYFTYSDPYSLFVSDTYNGLTSEMPLYDFGPKWYLEIAEDGTVTAPFNTNYFAPMSSWYAENNAIYESFFVAYQPDIAYIVGYMGDADGNVVNGHFPVEVSEDGNTITLKPLVYDETNFYPNAAINYGLGRFSVSVAVNSDVVITRKSASAAPAKVAKQILGRVKSQTAKAGQKIEAPARPASRQAIGEKVEYKMVAGPKHYTEQERGEMWVEARRQK